METLLQKIEARIAECSSLLWGKSFVRPNSVRVVFDLRGQVAGMARTNLQTGQCIMRVNEVLARENEAEYLQQTVPHEYAHFVTNLTRPGERAHGRLWQHVMRALGVEPRRCHSYDTANAEVRRTRKFIYTCACNRDFPLGIVRHRKIGRGAVYRCTRCRSPLIPKPKHTEV